MHRSENRRCKRIDQFIGTPEHALHSCKLVNIFYSGKCAIDKNNKKEAKENIEHFLDSYDREGHW